MTMSRLLSSTALGLAVIVSACASAQPQTPATFTTASRADERMIEVTEIAERLSLAAPAGNEAALSDIDRSQIIQFANDWDEQGRGKLIVTRPTAGANAAEAEAIAIQAQSVLVASGMSATDIQMRGGGEPGPVVLSFVRYEAKAPDCPSAASINLAAIGNGASPRFGCAVNANIVAMLDDPGDLLGPRPMGPANSQRRAIVMGKYVMGEATAQNLSNDQRSLISEAVQ
jgi:pilus assembly protein CpaD